ncbi:MAG TPA: tannase/feruloyl esterase family alpha/beta hydrolase [Bryobacteraceae bacterium]|nr:tannase/feruloyl esterase family alpha/beta hydrolase [Bryobacteraceae bacterium]
MKPLVTLIVVGLSSALPAAAAGDCAALSMATFPNATFTATAVPAGDFTPPQGAPLHNLPAFCRVSGVLKPTSDSNIQFEVWMPNTGWNGRLQGIGNGGFAGSIAFDPLGVAVSHGYAIATTDTGHVAGTTNASWALGHPEKIVDFGYRAIHETAVTAKAMIAKFYGDGPKHSYFHSCSNGGRQALMEAQRYPSDYDGIVAGAPAYYWTHLLTEAIWNSQALLADPASYIPASKLPALESATLAACDALDGVKDGVIDDPSKCHFDPSKLLCSGADSEACLTAPQIAALKKIYSGAQNSKGVTVFPGFPPGGETGPGGWAAWTTGAAPQRSLAFAFGTSYFANMIYGKADWDFRTFTVDRDMQASDEKMAKVLNATDPNLKPFLARGGKLIMYHGWSDAAIPPAATIEYYNEVVAKIGAKDSENFMRLYMVPGMQHCGGGPGPNVFGSASVPLGDPQHDAGRAMERWVEDGFAPREIIATKYQTGSNPASGVVRTRPLCPYPQVAHYKGSGSTDDAANFVCGK